MAIPEHHERHDGRGYPCGLEGEAISLGARIVSVVDAYDLMTNPRSYKRPATIDAARAEIACLSGSQFDPVVVRAFLAIPFKQLQSLQPPAWLGSVAVLADGPGRVRLGRTAAALVVVGSVLGFASWRPWSPRHVVGALAPSTADASGNRAHGTSRDPSGVGSVPVAGERIAQTSKASLTGHPSTKSGSRQVTTIGGREEQRKAKRGAKLAKWIIGAGRDLRWFEESDAAEALPDSLAVVTPPRARHHPRPAGRHHRLPVDHHLPRHHRHHLHDNAAASTHDNAAASTSSIRPQAYTQRLTARTSWSDRWSTSDGPTAGRPP